MTTKKAEALYLAEHMANCGGRPYAVFNPLDRPLGELPFIYGFNNGGEPGWLHAQLIAEDGTGMGSHICSSVGYMEHDLGIIEGSRPDRHESFKKHYTEGYRMAFKEANSPEILSAYDLNQKLGEEAENVR